MILLVIDMQKGIVDEELYARPDFRGYIQTERGEQFSNNSVQPLHAEDLLLNECPHAFFSFSLKHCYLSMFSLYD